MGTSALFLLRWSCFLAFVPQVFAAFFYFFAEFVCILAAYRSVSKAVSGGFSRHFSQVFRRFLAHIFGIFSAFFSDLLARWSALGLNSLGER